MNKNKNLYKNTSSLFIHCENKEWKTIIFKNKKIEISEIVGLRIYDISYGSRN